MTDPLRIRIRDDWDAALTYDSLDDGQGTAERAVFVGREAIIKPLVAEILEPNKRGTYLISGYRGTGKTTLLIEALILAQNQLETPLRLFPLVMNVSEIAASLGSVSADSPHDLNIDPRRLLIALLRTITHRLAKLKLKRQDLDDVAVRARTTYEKATAAKYSQTGVQSTERTSSTSREFAWALEIKNLLNTVGVVAAGTAVVMELLTLGRPMWVHGAAVALGAVAVCSLAWSYKRASSFKGSATSQTSIEYDNSLQQLETDLKDLLLSLKDKGLRTVVIMEELDKLDDDKGVQLAAVIRYFKNLFTQAPALFFFVTDKSYFDTIASAIKRARRKRSYAVEHTFFTHRIFVGRPTTKECLEYIAAIAKSDEDRARIQSVAAELGKPGRIDKVDQLGRFIRVVLFNAANHLFDLKNELRRYARKEGANGQTVTNFLIDDDTFPAEEAALAVFQDLIVEKSGSFQIKGGRAYANETLADSLYAVFNQVGSTREQIEKSFMPRSDGDADSKLLLDEQLDFAEATRIREAVISLINDLERGLAFEKRDNGRFIWRNDAARSFRYVRQLQRHEESLIADLQKHATLVKALASDPQLVDPLATEFEAEVASIRDAPETMNADFAASRSRAVVDKYANFIDQTFDALKKELEDYGFVFEQISRGVGGALYSIRSTIGDPRLYFGQIRGATILAFGETVTMLDDVWGYIAPAASPTLRPLNRVSIVHVIHTSGDVSSEVFNRWQQWQDALRARGKILSDLKSVVEVLPLTPSTSTPLTSTQSVVAALAASGGWCQDRPQDSIPQSTPPLAKPLEEWKQSPTTIFHINEPTSPTFRSFFERDTVEEDGTLVLNLLYPTYPIDLMTEVAVKCMMTTFGTVLGGPERWAPIGEKLLDSKRVIIYTDLGMAPGLTATDILKLPPNAKMIVVNPGELPPQLAGIPTLESPPPPPVSEDPNLKKVEPPLVSKESPTNT